MSAGAGTVGSRSKNGHRFLNDHSRYAYFPSCNKGFFMALLVHRPAYVRVASAIIVAFAAIVQGCGRADIAEELPREVDFNFHIKPILSNSCYVCHGPDISTREAELRLDTRDGAIARREGGRAIVPGNANRSLLIKRISSHDPEERMPPAKTNKILTEREVALLSKWIDQGAEYKTHWSLIDPSSPVIPEGRIDAQPIDRFVEARLEARGLQPASAASRESLIRRASYVLTGLPPTPEDVNAFLSDTAPDAFEKVIDKLLASPGFGERWARHWMDLVRYAEAKGHEFDFTIHGAWQYRDYLIRAFNSDVPYDQFVTEHLAGDLISEPRLNSSGGFNESAIGTAYFGLGEGKHSPVDTRIDEAERIDNIIDVTTKTFQGLTVACARCHDHKFDPIPTTDYYALYGIVESARFTPAPLLSTRYRTVLDSLEDLRRELRTEIASHWQGSIEPVPAVTVALRYQEAVPVDTAQSWIMLGDFRSGTLDGWFAHGPAFEGLSTLGSPVVDGFELDSLAAGVASSRKLVTGVPGALRSPTFTIEHDSITVFAAGYKSVIRIVVDNFQLIRAPIHGGLDRELVGSEMTPYRFDVAMWKGHKAYVELLVGTYDKNRFLTEQHTFVLNDSSYFEVAYAFGHNETMPEIPALAHGAVSLSQSIEAWESFRATTDHIAVINGSLQSGTLQGLDIRPALEAAGRVRARLPEVPFYIGMTDGDGVSSAVFGRGNYKTPVGDPVPRRFLTALDPEGRPFTRSASGRLDLAEAIASPDNPLTARVMVNRLWHHAFGRGIVKTVDNFGAQGALPTHPELLDYLALRFVELDWSIKDMLSEILRSEAFQRSTEGPEGVLEVDPENLLLSHYSVRRLEAEAIRDGVLAVSGRLDTTMYGPPEPIHLTEFMKGRGRPEINGALDGDGRRSLYIAIRRNFLSPMMLAFDTPIPFSAFGARNSSNVPAQSLTMLNDPFVAEQAQVWARALVASGHETIEARIRAVYLRALSRAPTEVEIEQAVSFIEDEAKRMELGAVRIMGSEELWAAYCHVVLNLKEFIYLV